MSNVFRIADLSFKIVSGRLDAFIDDAAMHWGIQIDASTEAPGFEDWRPRVSSDVLFATPQGAFGDWRDLAPRSTAWAGKNDEEIPSASLYVFEHAPIYKCTAECYGHNGGLRIRMRGKCDVHYRRDKYYDELDLEIDSPIDFVGILCGRRSEAECWRDLEPFLNTEDFVFTQTEHGVSVLKPTGC